MLRRRLSFVFLSFAILLSLIMPSASIVAAQSSQAGYSFGTGIYGAAYHDGYLYAVSRNNEQILRANVVTKDVEVVANTGSSPMAVALDSLGNLYYTQDSNMNIFKIPAASLLDSSNFPLATTASQIYTTLSQTFLYALAIDANDNMYVSPALSKTIYRLDTNHTLIPVMSGLREYLNSMTFDPSGDLYFVDGWSKYTIDQASLQQNLQSGQAILSSEAELVPVLNLHNNNYGMAFLPDGTLMVSSGNDIVEQTLSRSVKDAINLLPSNLTVTLGSYSNLLTYLKQISGMSATGVSLSLSSANANVSSDGAIVHSGNEVTGDVIVNVSKSGEMTKTKTIEVTVQALPSVTNAVYSATESSITLNWVNPNYPSTGTKIVNEDTQESVSVTSATYTFADLSANTEYHYTLYALYENGAQSSGVSLTASTLPAAPIVPISLISISAMPTSMSLDVGNSQASVVTATYSNGASVDVTESVSWSSDNPAVASVSNSGVVTGVAAGNAAITGQYDGLAVTISVIVKAQATGETDTGDIVTTEPSNGTNTNTNTNPNTATNPNPNTASEPAKPAPSNVFNSSVVTSDASVLEHLQSLLKSGTGITSFNDVDKHWAQKAISLFIQLNLVNGYEDGSFKPNAAISRAEFAALIDRVFDIVPSGTHQAVMNDISNHWARGTIEKLTSAGVLNGYGTSFRPDQKITRAEMVAIISRIVNLNAAGGTNASFSDVGGSYAAEQIVAAASAGIVSGKGNGKFDPEASSTRAEAITILLNTLKLSPEIKAFLDSLE